MCVGVYVVYVVYVCDVYGVCICEWCVNLTEVKHLPTVM